MKTRRELIAEVEELCGDLDEEVSTDRLNNAALAELVASLRARLDEKTVPLVTPATGAQRVKTSPESPMAKQLEEDKPRPPPPVVHDTVPAPKSIDGASPEAAGGKPPPEAAKTKAPSAPYYVAPGRSIVARGRVLGPLKPVKAEDFPGGQTDLDYFVVKGAVVERDKQ